MGVFSIFFRNKKEKLGDINSVSKKLFDLNNEDPSKKRSQFDIRVDIEELHKKLSNILFNAVNTNDLKTINNILTARFVERQKLVNEKGYNIIDYSLFNDKNELFKYLYNNLYDELRSCFINIPALFTIILNRKNFELIEFFLKDENLSEFLKKENITNCLFLAIQGWKKDLCDLIIGNYLGFLDSRNIEASMIYSISNAQIEELNLVFSYPTLISRFSNEGIEKMFALSVMNQNIKALEIMTSNERFMNSIEDADVNMLKSILQMAYNNGSVLIIQNFLSNNRLKNNVKNILRIGK